MPISYLLSNNDQDNDNHKGLNYLHLVYPIEKTHNRIFSNRFLRISFSSKVTCFNSTIITIPPIIDMFSKNLLRANASIWTSLKDTICTSYIVSRLSLSYQI